MSSNSGSTSRMSAATRAKPISSSVRELMRAAGMRRSPSDLEDEQSLWLQHEQSDHHEQREHLGHRAREEELERRLRWRDRERRSHRAEQALRSAEDDHQEGIDDVELAGRRP